MHIEGMLDALDGIDRYAPLGRERFEADELVQTFIIVQLMTLGGRASGLSPRLRAAHPQIAWDRLIVTGDDLLREYDCVDLPAVWDMVEHDLPPLREQLTRILHDLEAAPNAPDA